MTTPCPFCGDPLPPSKTRPRKFCSTACRRRYWERGETARVLCSDCGELAGPNSKGKRTKRCAPCRRVHDEQRVTERGQQIERWWKEGLSLQEIAHRLGWTRDYLSVEMDRLRVDGLDLPYRYRLTNPKVAELRKAA